MTATRTIPAWLELYRPVMAHARSRVESYNEAHAEAVRAAGERVAAFYQKLKALDNHPLPGAVALRVTGPRPELGEGRSIKVFVGGLPVVRLDFGFSASSREDGSPTYPASDSMSFFQRWTQSSGREWPKDHCGVFCERTVADYLLQLLG